MLVKERQQNFRKFSLAPPRIVIENDFERRTTRLPSIMAPFTPPTTIETPPSSTAAASPRMIRSFYEFNKLPTITTAPKTKLRRSTIAVNVASSFVNSKNRLRVPSIVDDLEQQLEDMQPSENFKRFSINSLIENFDNLKSRYSNQALEHRLSIDKLNTFKRKCSIAIARDEDYVDNVLKQQEQQQAKLQNKNGKGEDESKIINKNRLHIGSLLSYEGQFATLKCIEDAIKTKLKISISELSHSNERFNRKFNDKMNKRIYYHKVNLIKKLLTTLNLANNAAATLVMPHIAEMNLLRKSTISKHIEIGMCLLDEINSLLKSSSSHLHERKIRFSTDTWHHTTDSSLSSVFSNDENLEDEGVDFKMVYNLISKFSEWSALWIKSFQ